ncbi:Crp/Fnr family transcriptional regulator [Pseudooceanicola sp.]|uniref:Crp/Fnr family transcriptional regulator n=1 Tax=Pseudooceanicola sp. TaxID=1914328 RepID=UPI00263983DA|nr:Crp/Fnr family transcriptional regulator [Pseudooceanicola sp.]MDF1856047.1 Crp/Fnr family transcriptional regulator [Pseudooceanicola sp.]
MSRLDETQLGKLPPFSRLSLVEIGEILDLSSRKTWGEGDTIFAQGNPADSFYLLLDGSIRVLRLTPGGEQIVPLHIPAGQLFGIAPAMGLEVYPADAMAAVDCVTLSWPRRHWSDFVTRYDGFGSETWRSIGARMIELHDRIEELSTRAVEQRVAAVVLRLVRQYGRNVEAGIEITLPITRATIAEMTGTTLHTVSRLLSGWEKDGIVASKRKHITVTDAHRLVMIAEAG